MIFSSLEFLLAFLPVTLLGFLLLRQRARVALGWLVASSLFFYAWWKPVYISLLVGSIVINYLLAAGMRRYQNFSAALLVTGITINLGLLGWFKYADFMIDNLNWLFGLNMADLNIILPLAISFFTFQQIAFLVDCHRRIAEEHHLLDYTLFVSFFPQLIAGPIVHHNDVIPQFRHFGNQAYDFRNLQIGLTVLSIGLFKKLVIADGLAEVATPIFVQAESGKLISGVQAWFGALCYTFQLYFDFSGYSDMAIGGARLFGIRLPANFNSPYKSLSIIDFWRRWHMTLSRFLRDYLYITLGGNRKGYSRQLTNLMITMLLGGLWHGANWTFALWGGLHGIYLVINHLWVRFGGRWREQILERHWYVATSGLCCFIAVLIAWTIFRADSLDGALAMLTAMANPGDAAGDLANLVDQIRPRSLVILGTAMAISWCLPNLQQFMVREHLVLASRPIAEPKLIWQPRWYWAILTAALGASAMYKLIYIPNAVTEFIYFQF